MVVGFRSKGLEEIYLTGKIRRIGSEYVRKWVRIRQSLEVAALPEEMHVTGYRFHSLNGTPQRWSVRVAAHYRVTFGWFGENALDVDFEDYHQVQDQERNNETKKWLEARASGRDYQRRHSS